MTSTIQKYKDCLNAHDLDGVRALGTPDTQIDLGGLVMDFTTEYMDLVEDSFASFPDMQWAMMASALEKLDIEAKGTKCFSEIQEMELEVENGKITSAKLIPLENALSGPPRFYTQIGGKLDENPKE